MSEKKKEKGPGGGSAGPLKKTEESLPLDYLNDEDRSNAEMEADPASAAFTDKGSM